MLNQICIMGRFTKDPELRRTQNGTAVTSFTLAVDRDFKRDETDFIECVAWDKAAEFVEQYFFKGKMAVVYGRLQMREWTNKDGDRRKKAEVVADRVYFGDSRRDNTDDLRGGAMRASPPTGLEELEPDESDDGHLPF